MKNLRIDYRGTFCQKDVCMKKKNKKIRSRKIKEFRYHNVYVFKKNGKIKKLRHPTYAFLKIGNTFLYVVITHSKIVNGIKTIELRLNPNPNDNRKAYRSKTIEKDTKDRFGKPNKKWRMDPHDDAEIREQKNDDSADRTNSTYEHGESSHLKSS